MSAPYLLLVFGELILLVAATIPLGVCAISLVERFLQRSFHWSGVERLLAAFYATGAVLFVVASVPLPVYGGYTIGGLLLLGAAGLAFLAIRRREPWWPHIARSVRSIPLLLLAGATLGLLGLEIGSLGSLAYANAYDGATHSLWVTLLLRNHTLPWTLEPFAGFGVTYPQGAIVWQSLPVALFGWPVWDAPLYLPPLFLALCVPAAFVLGRRVAGDANPRREQYALLFAGFVALVASYPRLFVGGSFDFVFALPLFLLGLAWVPGFVGGGIPSARSLVVGGIAVGFAGSLSATVGLELLILLAVFGLAAVARRGGRLLRALGAFVGIAALAAAVLARSLLGLAIWSSYPGYVLTPVGNAPYAVPPPGSSLTYRYVTGLTDPFVLWKGRLSPIAWQSLEMQLLLVAGLVIVVMWFLGSSYRARLSLPFRLVPTLATAAVATFATLAALLPTSAASGPLAAVDAVSSLDEVSYLFFILLALVGILPLAVCWERVTIARPADRSPPSSDSTYTTADPTRRGEQHRRWRAQPRGPAIAGALVLAVAFGAGGVATVADAPGYIHGHIQMLADVSAGDVAALDWARSELPSCANVLVAPGSAAQYLPEYATVAVTFPAYPASYNLSYVNAVSALVDGTYDASTRADLLYLRVNTVFATGATTTQFEAFNASAFRGVPDFSTLFAEDDALILAFEPGIIETGCVP